MPINRRLMLGVWLMLCAGSALACLNTIRSRVIDAKASGDDAEVQAIAKEAEAAYAKDPSVEVTNDLAVARILTGRTEEGIELLRALEKRDPGRAIVAANLGTALELSGRLDEALQWIREGVRRDPTEHYGTEWLHVLILEARIALKRDQAWLGSHSVLNLKFDSSGRLIDVDLPRDEQGMPRSPQHIGEAVNYQTFERQFFVNPPDPVIADLHYSAAELLAWDKQPAMDAADDDVTDILNEYQQALDYGTRFEARAKSQLELFNARFEAHIEGIDQRNETVVRNRAQFQRSADQKFSLLIGLAGLALGSAVTFLILRRRRATKP